MHENDRSLVDIYLFSNILDNEVHHILLTDVRIFQYLEVCMIFVKNKDIFWGGPSSYSSYYSSGNPPIGPA